MAFHTTTCITFGGTMDCCPMCESTKIIKNGRSSMFQRYKCKVCGKSFQLRYKYRACYPYTNKQIIALTKEAVGIRSTARLLGLSVTTVIRRIKHIAEQIKPPPIVLGRSYEVDELRTYIGTKKRKVWVVSALDRVSGSIVAFNVGARTNKTLHHVLTSITLSKPLAIYTDGLKNYQYLINRSIHRTTQYGTNHIERFHLNLRTHLKRLQRRTICYSRSVAMLVCGMTVLAGHTLEKRRSPAWADIKV